MSEGRKIAIVSGKSSIGKDEKAAIKNATIDPGEIMGE
jgi:hypothetical protein